MNKLEKQQDEEAAFRTSFEGMQSKMQTALPGIIVDFNPAKMTCTVQPALRSYLRQEDGSLPSVVMPLLINCPVVFPSGGNCSLTFPIQQGDECLVVFASRCIDAWWQSGGVQEQLEKRMHTLSDGFVLAGCRSIPRVIPNISLTSTQLRSDDGETFVEVNPSGQIVTIKAPVGIVLDAPVVTLTGSFSALNTGGANSFSVQGNVNFLGTITSNGKPIDSTHTHTGVDAGGDISGPVA